MSKSPLRAQMAALRNFNTASCRFFRGEYVVPVPVAFIYLKYLVPAIEAEPAYGLKIQGADLRANGSNIESPGFPPPSGGAWPGDIRRQYQSIAKDLAKTAFVFPRR